MRGSRFPRPPFIMARGCQRFRFGRAELQASRNNVERFDRLGYHKLRCLYTCCGWSSTQPPSIRSEHHRLISWFDMVAGRW